MRNYLRVRGEYCFIIIFAFLLRELPPRTRRIRLGARLRVRRSGTTSAYAENTNQGPGHGHRGGNYLRVRGEYRIKAERERKLAELPPRTRRILPLPVRAVPFLGTTSAYAENTPRWINQKWIVGELPPRTRRIQNSAPFISAATGTTSAYAENTP